MLTPDCAGRNHRRPHLYLFASAGMDALALHFALDTVPWRAQAPAERGRLSEVWESESQSPVRGACWTPPESQPNRGFKGESDRVVEPPDREIRPRHEARLWQRFLARSFPGPVSGGSDFDGESANADCLFVADSCPHAFHLTSTSEKSASRIDIPSDQPGGSHVADRSEHDA